MRKIGDANGTSISTEPALNQCTLVEGNNWRYILGSTYATFPKTAQTKMQSAACYFELIAKFVDINFKNIQKKIPGNIYNSTDTMIVTVVKCTKPTFYFLFLVHCCQPLL